MATENIRTVKNPIDVMPLIHKAFRTLSDRTEATVGEAPTFDDVLALNEAFAFRINQIHHHATVEDEVMAGPMQDHRPARENETEHADLSEKAGELASFIPLGNPGSLEEIVREAAFPLDDEQHNLLAERFHDVETT